jgi:NAD(P)-dependent dehydrogenase (short-subunit alcohol dehydrogenase family)
MRIFTRAFDIASSAPCISFIAEVIKHLGHIDHVFNWPTMNPAPLQLATITDEHWDRLVNTNLKGLFNITRACIPHLEAGTSFVNASFAASSIAGLSYPTASLAVYNASVIGFSKFMASEFSPRGIRTNILVLSFPDPVLTNMGLPEDTQNVSSERPKQPGEIAAVVCSFMEDGGSQTNGHLFEITGGVA